MGIKVRAKSGGFHGTWRDPGAEFTVKSKADVGKWMEVIGKPAKSEAKQEPEPKGDDKDPQTDSDGAGGDDVDKTEGGDDGKPAKLPPVEDRIKAVDATNDIDELEAVVKNDGSKQVRDAAAAKLKELKQ